MKKNAIVLISLIVLAVIGLMFLGRFFDRKPLLQAEVTVKSALSAAEPVHDFGAISMKDGNIAYKFKVTNPTDKDLPIVRLSTSCMCTVAYVVESGSKAGPYGMAGMSHTKANAVFKAGETKNIEVVFDPNAHGPAGVGPMQRYVHLIDATGGALQLEIKGMVRP